MSDVQRYNIEERYDTDELNHIERDDGDWVKWEDIKNREADVDTLVDQVIELTAETKDLNKQLTKATSDLKAAEQLIQSQVKVMDDQSDKIRQLTKGA